MKETGILFDLDGTLLDTLEDLRNAVNFAMRESDCPEHSLEEIRSFVGDGAALLIQRALAGTGKEAQWPQVLEVFRSYYNAHCQVETKPYPGILEALAVLKERGYRLAMVSNKPDNAVQILNEDYFKGIFPIAQGEVAGVPRKPAPDMPLLAAEKLGISPERCIYVGDSEVDVQTARNAGMTCLSVTWEFRDEAVMAREGSVYFCRETGALVNMIEQLEADICGK